MVHMLTVQMNVYKVFRVIDWRKKMNRTKFSAFTLAETLLTLGIIGVIAAMTIPGLQQHHQLQTNVALAQKAYSTLANVTKELKLENGSVRMWDLNSAKAIADLYKTKLNYVGAPDASETYDVKQLNNSAAGLSGDMFNQDSAFVTADGMLYFIEAASISKSCSGDTAKDACFHIRVDTNGMKGPNTVGLDVLQFVVANDGVYPYGAKDGTDMTACVRNAADGWACTARMIRQNKITWK